MASSQEPSWGPHAAPSFSRQGTPGEILGYWGFLAALPCSRATSDGQPLPHLALTWAGLAVPATFVGFRDRLWPHLPSSTHVCSSQGEGGLSPLLWCIWATNQWDLALSVTLSPFMWPLQWMPCFLSPRFGHMTVTSPKGFLPAHEEFQRRSGNWNSLSSRMRGHGRQACGLSGPLHSFSPGLCWLLGHIRRPSLLSCHCSMLHTTWTPQRFSPDLPMSEHCYFITNSANSPLGG